MKENSDLKSFSQESSRDNDEKVLKYEKDLLHLLRAQNEGKNQNINGVALILPSSLPVARTRAEIARVFKRDAAKAHESCFQTQNDVIFQEKADLLARLLSSSSKVV